MILFLKIFSSMCCGKLFLSFDFPLLRILKSIVPTIDANKITKMNVVD